MATTTENLETRLASARELVARCLDGHELGSDELAMVVEAGLLGELLSALGGPPLWPNDNDTTTHSEDERCQNRT